MKLSTSQKELLDILSKHKNDPLTIREIQELLGISSTSVVAHHIKQLEKKGLLKRNPTNPRDYILINEEDGMKITYLNLYGMAQCGPKGSILEGNPIDKIAISSELVKFPISDVFLVKAKGDSMAPKINNGDIVFVRKSNIPENGNIVLCVNDGEVLIKKFSTDGKNVVLTSINSEKYPSFVAKENFKVEGIVNGVLTYKI